MKPEEFKAKVKRGQLDQSSHKENYIICINCLHIYKKTNSFKYRTIDLTNEIQSPKLDQEQLPEANVLTVRKEAFGNQSIVSTKTDKRYREICSRECAAQLTEQDQLITCDNKQCNNILPYNQMVEKRITDDNHTLLDSDTHEAEKHIAQQMDNITVIDNPPDQHIKKPEYSLYCSDKCATAAKL